MSDVIVVAVCARPGAPLLGDCLAALARAGVAAPVVETAAAGHGLAVARNAALERAEAGDVIAYVDDDVLVGAGWLRALDAAWAAAPAGVAAIGGPLETIVRGARPAWLDDELLAALAVTGPAGSGPFDPSQRTLPAGNLSFRESALRGVGGFWPARGRAGDRDWFTEEHEVQRELGRAGWDLRQDDALAARRVAEGEGLTRRGVIAARARSGARRAVLGGATRGSTQHTAPGGERAPGAARGVARSASGAVLAAARGDGATAVARAARAAEHAGTLAGPLLVHGETQPVASSTPFRHAIASVQPGPLRARLSLGDRAALAQPGPLGARLGRLPGSRRDTTPLVLALHRVADVESDPLGLALAPARFAALLGRLRAERTPAPLDAIVAGEAPSDAVAVTLDDGYVDNLTVALPLLEAAEVPATVFVSTGHVEEGRAFWWDELDRLLRTAAPAAGDSLRVELAGDHRAWPARTAGERAVAAGHLFAWLPAHLPEAIDAALGTIAAWAGVARGVDDADRPMTIDELRRLAASPLVTIGSHGRTHPSLALVEPERRDQELRRSSEDLAAWLGVAPTAFAYPFGVWATDVDAATRDAVAAAGYACAVVNTVDVPRGDRLLIPRAPGGAYAAQASPGP
jgi:peptidoglycan/xylan/chitin deacetylase (PgdA/CDA1 family)